MQELSDSCLLAVKLLTGRTHQIRVHLSHVGLPLWGDPLYGQPEASFDRPALHAVRLNFIQPRTLQKLKFQADIPTDFRLLMSQLSNHKL